jgi:quinol monooxygenase YgiN
LRFGIRLELGLAKAFWKKEGLMPVLMDTRMKVLPQKRQELLRTLAIMEDKIVKETGCRDCRLSQDKDDENIFFLTMEWQSQESLDSYLKSNQHGVFLGALQVLCEYPEFSFRTTQFPF